MTRANVVAEQAAYPNDSVTYLSPALQTWRYSARRPSSQLDIHATPTNWLARRSSSIATDVAFIAGGRLSADVRRRRLRVTSAVWRSPEGVSRANH